jgi:hypothetical protein
LHAALVLHKESAKHAPSRGSDGGAPSGSDSHQITESAPAIKLQGFLRLLPRLFFQIKKSANKISFPYKMKKACISHAFFINIYL